MNRAQVEISSFLAKGRPLPQAGSSSVEMCTCNFGKIHLDPTEALEAFFQDAALRPLQDQVLIVRFASTYMLHQASTCFESHFAFELAELSGSCLNAQQTPVFFADESSFCLRRVITSAAVWRARPGRGGEVWLVQ